ncbi:hypothetical protein H2199_003302 [Coniosporium tulheliwenetii]|uniref:Uncharacterized protein n=1 Tax=Coniosporium tulheliwenetii TaxID=3383036 RepID=A0ACC2ZBU9_9PEZI|nr:hypothetical protein H2199_003302 [Cladosporium sp. JES 115]
MHKAYCPFTHSQTRITSKYSFPTLNIKFSRAATDKPTPPLNVPPSPLFPDSSVTAVILKEFDARDFGDSADELAFWLNARWKKSGYSIDGDTVLQLLRSRGRDPCRGRVERLQGRFLR